MSLLQNQTQVNGGTSFFAAAGSGGGGGGGSGSFSTITASTITVSSFVKAGTFLTATSTFASLPFNTSTLLYSTENPGIYAINCTLSAGTNSSAVCASLEAVSAAINSGNTYTSVSSMTRVSTAGDFTIGSSAPTLGQPGPVEFYIINTNSNTTPVCAASITQLG